MTREPDRSDKLDLNLNDSVWVRVTAVGEQVYRQHWTALRMDPIPLRRDADGWTMFQLWELAHIFGAAMYNGGPVPVETTIRVRALASPAAAPAAEPCPICRDTGKTACRKEPVAPSLRADYEKSLSMPIDGGKQALDRVDAVLAKHAPAPSLLPRVLAALEEQGSWTLAAELRRYIAEMKGKMDPVEAREERLAEERHAASMLALAEYEKSARKIGERIDAQKRIAELEGLVAEANRQLASLAARNAARSEGET